MKLKCPWMLRWLGDSELLELAIRWNVIILYVFYMVMPLSSVCVSYFFFAFAILPWCRFVDPTLVLRKRHTLREDFNRITETLYDILPSFPIKRGVCEASTGNGKFVQFNNLCGKLASIFHVFMLFFCGPLFPSELSLSGCLSIC